jgi:predicted PurR-regulated permease PerM
MEFFKGLINVCFIMACYYSTCFTLIGIDFSLLLGILTGFSIAIPLVGILASTLFVIFITIFHFGLDWHLTYVGLISLCGQMLENYIITPKIVGEKIGLAPMLMIISLLVWGKLFGIVGLFLAIPMTCVLNVILKNVFEAT